MLLYAVAHHSHSLAEALKMHDLALTEEFDDVVDIGVVTESEDIVIGNAGLLLRCITIWTKFNA